jgi:hypothetical protein
MVRGEAAGREVFEEVIRDSENMVDRRRQTAQTGADVAVCDNSLSLLLSLLLFLHNYFPSQHAHAAGEAELA